MAGTYSIRIPEGDKAFVEALQKLTVSDFEKFVEAVAAAEPRIDMDNFADQIRRKWAVEEADQIGGIAEMALRATRAVEVQEIPAIEVVDAILEVVAESKADNSLGSDQLRSRIEKLMGIESIRITANALTFLTSHGHVFRDVTIFSDIRPIFLAGAKETSEPRASVIVHQMRLGVRHHGEDNPFFISLDDADIIELRDSLDEAVRRSDMIRSREESCGRTVVRN